MYFKDLLVSDYLKKYLTYSADTGIIPHAQLFLGPEGSGTLPTAIAYAQYLLCDNTDGENLNGNASCNLKVNSFSHPDLHFVYPVATTDKITSKPTASSFITEWRQFLTNQPYGNLLDWYKLLEVSNKQLQIGVDEATEINKTLSLKSFEGGYKVLIIWMAELMNIACANKLLKLLEEPPNKTIFILVAENEDALLETIKSRCQVLKFPSISENAIVNALINNYQIESNVARGIAQQSNGNYNKALDLIYKDTEEHVFESWFINWVRTAFKAKGNKASINQLISWAEGISNTGRETQKNFLSFAINFFRQALLTNYGASKLVYLQPVTENFTLERFAPFIHNANIFDIIGAIEEASYHIERNGNSKIIFTDLAIKLTRLIHKTANA